MTKIDCPFCGNVHETEEMDLTAHFGPYLQGLGHLEDKLGSISPDRVLQAMKALRNETGNSRFTVRMSDLTDGWTGD